MNKLLIAVTVVAVVALGAQGLAAAQVELVGKPGGGEKTGYYCRTPGDRHPALNTLAETYDADYSLLLSFFCEGRFGVGEIRHALQASLALNGELSPTEILNMKVELGGWGRVWQELGLKGGGHGNGNGNRNGNGNGG